MRCSALLAALAIAACAPGPLPRPAFNLAAPEPSPEATRPASATPNPSPTPAASVLAGSEQPGFADGPGPQARFSDPLGLCVAPDGALLVADRLNHRIRRVAPDGTVSTLAGSGASGFQDDVLAAARFAEPTAVVADAQGLVYVADPFNHRVRRLGPDDRGQQAVGTLVGGPVAGSFDGGARVAGFDHPYALALDAHRRLFVAERFGHTLRMVQLDGDGRATTVRTIAGAYEQPGTTDGPGGAARFDRPSVLAWDPRVADHTVLYLAEDQRCALRRVDVDEAGSATVATLNGAATGCGYADGPVAQARFDRPQALLVDPERGLLLADAGNGALRAFQGADLAVTSPIKLPAPGGLAPAPGGALYAVDGNRIRRVAF